MSLFSSNPIIVETKNKRTVKVTFNKYGVKNADKLGTVRVLMLKGERGNDGTVSFDELTPEQKAELKGDKGDTGATGVGIASTVLNNDYTLTITLTDGTSYTTPSIRGAKGEQGDDYVLTNQDKADIAALVTLPTTGWVDLTNYAVTNNVTIEPTQWGAIRIGNMVQLYLGFNPKTDWAVGSEYNIIENLPAKLRPSMELQLVCWAQHPFAMVRVGTDGTIKACQRSGQSRGTSFWIRAHVSYLCNAAFT